MASPKGEEAVFFLYSFGVGMQDMFPSGQSGDQHNQGGFRQMEIGDQPIQHLKAVARVDKDIGPPCGFLQRTIFGSPTLNGTAGRGTHTDDPSPVLLGLVDDPRGFRWDHTVLAVHLMVCDVLRFDRPERTQAHMEGHVAEVYPHGLDLLQECFRRSAALP